jgi:hypothetical protein
MVRRRYEDRLKSRKDFERDRPRRGENVREKSPEANLTNATFISENEGGIGYESESTHKEDIESDAGHDTGGENSSFI